MENKIQELTDKIYREGVEKGNEEAQRLIANAQEEAKKIIEDARKEAESIVNSSRKSADELAENTKSELKLFAGQAVNALKSEIATMVTDKLITASVKDFAQDKDYLNAFIVALASKWSIDEPIVISTADAESLKKYFAAHAKALLDKGLCFLKREEELNEEDFFKAVNSDIHKISIELIGSINPNAIALIANIILENNKK